MPPANKRAVPVTVDRRAAHKRGVPIASLRCPRQVPVGAACGLDREINRSVASIGLHAIRGQGPAGAPLLAANRDGELNAAKPRPSGRGRAAQGHSLRSDLIAPFVKEITADDHMSDRFARYAERAKAS